MPGRPPKKKRRGGPRSRTGCQTCKRRHTRCDEVKPICGNCHRLDLDCEQSGDAAWIVNNHESVLEQNEHGENTAPLLIDVFRSRMSDLDFALDDPTEHTPINFITPPAATDTGISTRKVHLNAESAFLLQTYVRTVATWMDIFDHGSTYQHKIPRLVMASPLLFHCVCAFTANHLALSNSNRNPSWKLTAVRHYGEALRLLIEALSLPSHEHALTASMLLLSYEIHEAQRSEDYYRHFLGLTMLIRDRGSTAQSQGIERANFWIYIRHEIVVAITNEQPLVLDPIDWAMSRQEGETREDVLGNHVLWILARVLNLIYGPDSRTDQGRLRRQDFLTEVEAWRASLSDTFVGVGYGDKDQDGFRKVYFPVVAAAAAAFWYHIVHILLYTEPILQDESYIPLIQDQATRVTNIAISDFPPALMVFSTHGLFFAAKHIHGISRKARIWKILEDVEAQTGYSTRATVRQLQGLVENQG